MYPNELLLFFYTFIIVYSHFLLLPIANCSLVMLGNNVLYMCNGMMLPLLPVSTLYGTITLFLLADVFKSAFITEWFLLKWIEFIFTKSMLLLLHCLGLFLAPHHS